MNNMLAYYQKKLRPGGSCAMDHLDDLAEPFHRSSSPSKDKPMSFTKGPVPFYLQPRMLFLFVITAAALVLVACAATFNHQHPHRQLPAHQQQVAPYNVQPLKYKSQGTVQDQLRQRMAPSKEWHNTTNCMDQNLHNGSYNCADSMRLLAADVAKYKSLAKKAYGLLRETRSAYKIVRSTAEKALAELQALKDARAQLQEQNAALLALVAQDSYAMIAPSKAQGTPNGASFGNNSTKQDRDLLELAGKVALAVPAASDANSTSSSREVLLVVCNTAHSHGFDAFKFWCQSAALAELDNTIVLAADDSCARLAHEAGLHSTLYQTPQATKYAAAKVLLAEGFSVLAAEPDMMLVDSPYQYLLPSAQVDLHIMPDTLAGHVELQSKVHHSHGALHGPGLSPALMHLKPNKACLDFVSAVIQGLQASGTNEQLLLDQLLHSSVQALPNSSAPTHTSAESTMAQSSSSAAAAAGELGATAATEGTATATSSAATLLSNVKSLQTPPRLHLLPLDKFTTSVVLFGAHGRSEWLARTAPATIHVLHTPDKLERMAAIVNSYRGLPGPLEALAAVAPTPAQLAKQDEASSGSSMTAGYLAQSSHLPHLTQMLHPVEQLLHRLGIQ